ncbi:MAG: exodeoxyribonuclease V gamma subunit [Gammaproteobacteria bacterium]
MITVHYSNRLERLVSELSTRVLGPSALPLAPELVAVPHPGVRRWLSLALADECGIVANIEFPLPASLIWRLLHTLLPQVDKTSAFEGGPLRWGVLAELEALVKSKASTDFNTDTGAEVSTDLRTGTSPGGGDVGSLERTVFVDDDDAAPVSRYLSAANPMMQYELASRLARQLDTYLVYRPDWVRQWAQGRLALGAGATHEVWQADLYRALRTRLGSVDWLWAADELSARLAAGDIDTAMLPDRVHLFCVTSLSPAYIDLLAGLSAYIDIHIYCLNPCQEYWADIIAMRPGSSESVAPADSVFAPCGNPLLASLGRVGRELIDLLHDVGAVEAEHYVETDESTMLKAVQQDVLTLNDRTASSAIDARLADSLNAVASLNELARDQTLQVHVCHSPLREMEVLHDQLLALFDANTALAPDDIVVMTPNIDDYAPAIKAVFGHDAASPSARSSPGARTGTGKVSIPFAVADQRPASASALVGGFLKLLEAAQGRFAADEIFGLLGNEALCAAFGISPDALPVLMTWVEESGIRWGADARTRSELGLPEDDRHTWRFGLERMLLGLAMDADGDELFARLCPYGGVAGEVDDLVEGFSQFVDAVISLSVQTRTNRSPSAWAHWMREVAQYFFVPRGIQVNEMQLLLRAIAGVARSAEQAHYESSIPLGVMVEELNAVLPSSGLERTDATRSMFSARVTFCEMVPMRSIPFQVICLVGMSDEAFPRSEPSVGFDLTEQFPRRGDRSRRDDDRYLFLECLLAAREVFYVSYVGLDNRQNTSRPPSPVVAEFVDYIENGFDLLPGALTVQHPLQAFSRRYFDDTPDLFSYDHSSLNASCALVARDNPGPNPGLTAALPFVSEPLVRDVATAVAVDELIAFLVHPARYLFEQQLRAQIDDAGHGLSSVEPMVPNALERQRLRQAISEALPKTESVNDVATLLWGAGQLASGAVGEAVVGREIEAVREFVRVRESYGPTSVIDVDVEAGGTRVVGRLPGWCASEELLVNARLGRFRQRDLVELWVRHLLGCAQMGPLSSRFISIDTQNVLTPVSAPHEHLATLVEVFLQGVKAPVPFFPSTSYEFVKHCDKDIVKARGAAKVMWTDGGSGTRNAPWAESRDAYNSLAFRGEQPLGERFEALAKTIMSPIREYLVEQNMVGE